MSYMRNSNAGPYFASISQNSIFQLSAANCTIPHQPELFLGVPSSACGFQPIAQSRFCECHYQFHKIIVPKADYRSCGLFLNNDLDGLQLNTTLFVITVSYAEQCITKLLHKTFCPHLPRLEMFTCLHILQHRLTSV